jgi:hypothetical protein
MKNIILRLLYLTSLSKFDFFAVSSSNMETFIQIEGEMDKLGKIMWIAETCYPAGYGAVLKFEFESDQSYLNNLIKELEEILTSYPVIGTP